VKKITAFVGSGRRGYTLRAAEQLGENLRAFGDVEYEVVRLADYRIETCRGCKACFDKGEELCPLKDDRDELIAKIDSSDGVVLATPNYSFQVSGYTKTFLDRLGFLFHRPRFFGKTYAPLVAQGIYGGGKILKYLGFVGNGLGFNTVKGSCLVTIEPMSVKAERAFAAKLGDLADRFHRRLNAPAFPRAGLFGLVMFRMSRTKIRSMLDDRSPDWRYFSEQGWFESDFYYPTRIGPLKKAAGRLVDAITRRTSTPGGGRKE
jgi:multimeric flavodoxin WrbA